MAGIEVIDSHPPFLRLLLLLLYLLLLRVVKGAKETNSEAFRGSANGRIEFLRACGIEFFFPSCLLHAGRSEKANTLHGYCQVSGGQLIDVIRGSHFKTDRELLIFHVKFKERAVCQILSYLEA